MTSTSPIPHLTRAELDEVRRRAQARLETLPVALDIQPGEDARRAPIQREANALLSEGLERRDWSLVQQGTALLQQGEMFRIKVRRPFNLGGKLTAPGETIYAALPVAFNRTLDADADADDPALERELVARGYAHVRFRVECYIGGGASQPVGSTRWLARGDAQGLALGGRVEILA